MNQNNQYQKSSQTQQPVQKTENCQEEAPFLITQDSFKNTQSLKQFQHQKSMLFETCETGRKLLMQKQYESAAKELSKSIMTFQYIMKNSNKFLSKEQIQNLVLKTVLPTYNNLALCYIKLKNYQIIPTLTNQVLSHDPDNIKARYRRAQANMHLNKFQQSINDFQIVRKMDQEMKAECQALIKQCRILQQKSRVKRKNIAKKFISGYDGQERTKSQQINKIKREKLQLQRKNKNIRDEGQKKKKNMEHKSQDSIGFRIKVVKWISQKCQKLSNIIRFRTNQNEKETNKQSNKQTSKQSKVK